LVKLELSLMFLARLLILLLLLSPCTAALAQDYPSRPIAMIVPFSAGGPGDVIARILGSAMSATLKQSIVIENVVGAGGTLGTNRVAKAAPDVTRCSSCMSARQPRRRSMPNCRSIRSATSP